MGERDRQHNESWFGTPIQSSTGVIERPRSDAEVEAILKDDRRFPSPVRPVGSRHSMTPCISAGAAGEPGKWGTLVDMTSFTTLSDEAGNPTNLPLRVNWEARPITVTVPAGRTFYDVAHELRSKQHGDVKGLQFRVNTELGTLTMGAAACGATKDSSFPGEYGQVCSDVVGMRLITPDGKRHNLKDGDEDFAALRCSYGLFGIVTEVTFRVEEHRDISIRHEKCKLGEFPERSREWLSDGNAVFLYLFPHDDRIVAELRKKVRAPAGERVEREEKSARLEGRNFFWRNGLHVIAKAAGRMGPARDEALDALDEALEIYFVKQLQIDRVSPVGQIVDFDKEDTEHRFTFSMWAFPEGQFARILPEYFRFCKDRQAIFRAGLPHVSYHIARDPSSLLSYSHSHPVWTLDPICPEVEAHEPGWEQFLREFNGWCSALGGVPLLNQTPHLDRSHLTSAFGQRLRDFETARRRLDPGNRMLNDYFAKLLAP